MNKVIDYRHHVITDGSLTINPLDAEDFGEYICFARNEHGVSEGIVALESTGLLSPSLYCMTSLC